MNRKNLSGQKFAMLTAISLAEIKFGRSYWHCICDCGNQKIVMGSRLVYGSTKSCGCLQKQTRIRNKTKHGLSHTNEYQIWLKIKDRCYSVKNPAYPRYGGRGIAMSESWMNFENFFNDMGKRPSLNHSIDRIDCNKGYEKENCRWATYKEQNNNRRNNIFHELNGVFATLSQHCDIHNLSYKNTHQKMKRTGKNLQQVFNKLKLNT